MTTLPIRSIIIIQLGEGSIVQIHQILERPHLDYGAISEVNHRVHLLEVGQRMRHEYPRLQEPRIYQSQRTQQRYNHL